MKTVRRRDPSVGQAAPAVGGYSYLAGSKSAALPRRTMHVQARLLRSRPPRIGRSSRTWSAVDACHFSRAEPSILVEAPPAEASSESLLRLVAGLPLDIDLTEFAVSAVPGSSECPSPKRSQQPRTHRGRRHPRAVRPLWAPVSVLVMSVLAACSSVNMGPAPGAQDRIEPLMRITDGGVDVAGLYSSARHYQDQGRHDLAVPILQRAALAAPSDAKVLNALGVSYAETGRLDAAIDTLRRANAAAPDEAFVLSNLAVAYLLADRPIDAVEPAQRAVELDKTSYKARRSLQRALAALKRNDAVLAAEPQSTPQTPVLSPAPIVSHLVSVPLKEVQLPAWGRSTSAYGIEVVEAQGRLVEVAPNVYELHSARHEALIVSAPVAKVDPTPAPSQVPSQSMQSSTTNATPTAADAAPDRLRLAHETSEQPAPATTAPMPQEPAPLVGIQTPQDDAPRVDHVANGASATPEATPPLLDRMPATPESAVEAQAPARLLPAEPAHVAYRLEVANGMGREGAARAVGRELLALGAPAAHLTNERPYTRSQTTVYFRPSFEKEALGIAQALGAKVERDDSGLSGGVDVRVALGRDVPAQIAQPHQTSVENAASASAAATPNVPVFAGLPSGLRTQSTYRLEIANGMGLEGAAREIGRELVALGAPAAHLTNERPYTRSQTTVYYRPPFEKEALGIAQALDAKVTRADTGLSDKADVRVALGHNLHPSIAQAKPEAVGHAELATAGPMPKPAPTPSAAKELTIAPITQASPVEQPQAAPTFGIVHGAGHAGPYLAVRAEVRARPRKSDSFAQGVTIGPVAVRSLAPVLRRDVRVRLPKNQPPRIGFSAVGAPSAPRRV